MYELPDLQVSGLHDLCPFRLHNSVLHGMNVLWGLTPVSAWTWERGTYRILSLYSSDVALARF